MEPKTFWISMNKKVGGFKVSFFESQPKFKDGSWVGDLEISEIEILNTKEFKKAFELKPGKCILVEFKISDHSNYRLSGDKNVTIFSVLIDAENEINLFSSKRNIFGIEEGEYFVTINKIMERKFP